MGKKAVLIGINYPGTKAELKGCINDVKRMYKCLLQRYGFEEEKDIKVLLDTADSYVQPTRKNIRKALNDLIISARPDDFLFVHYSGHGTKLPAETGDDDDTGYDECIVPSEIGESHKNAGDVEESESGFKFGFGSFLHKFKLHHRDDEEEVDDRVVEEGYDESGYFKSKSLPLSTLIEMLKQKTGRDDIDVGKVRPTLFDVFGDDVAPKVKKFMSVMGKIGGLELQFLKQKLDDDERYENRRLRLTCVARKRLMQDQQLSIAFQTTVEFLSAVARSTKLQEMPALQETKAKLMEHLTMPRGLGGERKKIIKISQGQRNDLANKLSMWQRKRPTQHSVSKLTAIQIKGPNSTH